MALASNALTSISRCETMLSLTAGAQDTLLEILINGASKRIENFIGYSPVRASYTEYYEGNDTQRLYLAARPIVGTPTITVDSIADTDFTVFANEGYLYKEGGWWRCKYADSGLVYTDSDPSMGKRNITVVYAAGWISQAGASRTFTAIDATTKTISLSNTSSMAVGDTVTLSNGTTTENLVIATITANVQITVTTTPTLTYTTTKTITLTPNMPDDLELACISLVGIDYLKRNTRGITAEKTPGGYSVQYNIEGVVPQGKAFPDDVKAMLDPYRRLSFG